MYVVECTLDDEVALIGPFSTLEVAEAWDNAHHFGCEGDHDYLYVTDPMSAECG